MTSKVAAGNFLFIKNKGKWVELEMHADDDDHSGGFELSCEIIIHHYFLVFKHIKRRYCENYTILCFLQSYRRVKTHENTLNYPNKFTPLRHNSAKK